MSEAKLREAFALMKQGDKRAAGRIVQEVLREDRNNVSAWWLLVHILEDEDKVVKALQQVLSLNPEHAAARQKLASLRPEYAELVPLSEKTKAKTKTDQQNAAYWGKLNNADKNSNLSEVLRAEGLQWLFRSRIGFRLLLLLIVAIIATIMSIAELITDIFTPDNPQAAIESNEILMAMENNPESVTRAYYEAFIREDVTALGAIVCSADQAWLTERIAEFENLEPERVSVDFSATRFSLDESEANQAYVSIHGTTGIKRGGSELTINWDERAISEGFDSYGLYLQKIDETWFVCAEEG